jgi:hypothetical protein
MICSNSSAEDPVWRTCAVGDMGCFAAASLKSSARNFWCGD